MSCVFRSQSAIGSQQHHAIVLVRFSEHIVQQSELEQTRLWRVPPPLKRIVGRCMDKTLSSSVNGIKMNIQEHLGRTSIFYFLRCFIELVEKKPGWHGIEYQLFVRLSYDQFADVITFCQPKVPVRQWIVLGSRYRSMCKIPDLCIRWAIMNFVD